MEGGNKQNHLSILYVVFNFALFLQKMIRKEKNLFFNLKKMLFHFLLFKKHLFNTRHWAEDSGLFEHEVDMGCTKMVGLDQQPLIFLPLFKLNVTKLKWDGEPV